jgi:glycosyltransferase involved in cell wall biosynthesis
MNARVPEGVPAAKITHWPAFGIQYYLRQRRSEAPDQLTGAYLWAGREFCRRIIQHGLGKAKGVYTFNSAGLELLEHAREQGLFRVMEQTIAPCPVEDRLLAEERAAWLDWDPPRQGGPFRAALAARERAEWECADLIVCGSDFVRRGIAECGGPAERCVVVPYGVGAYPPQDRQQRPLEDILHVLAVGEVGLRKGAPYVLEAACAAKGLAQFRWCGRVAVSPVAAMKLAEWVELPGAVPRPRIEGHYAWANVFLLPSICEGSATVCYEALASGLPIITTENAGSVVRDAIDGFIVPIRDSEAVAEKLCLLARDRELLKWMSDNARARAREFTVPKYGERLLAAMGAAWSARTSADSERACERARHVAAP